jgi:aldose 1-epimerase
MIDKILFGQMPDGQLVEEFALTNGNNVSIKILNLGGIIRAWHIPVENGEPLDIVLGFDNLQAYLTDDSYLGALVGRYANRINKGKFHLGAVAYQTNINQQGNCLHGGNKGFNSRIWQTTVLSEAPNPSIMLELTSPDGDQGFPGNIKLKTIYTLSEQNCLSIEYFAQCDQNTVYNPTNHSYFNLAGHQSGSVKNHKMQLYACHFTPIDEQCIPTGEIIPVKNTPFDFTELKSINTGLCAQHQQISFGNGLDHNWCLDQFDGQDKSAHYVGYAVAENSGVTLKVYTSMPGMQVFTANHFSDKRGKEEASYQANQGICFETQFYPDSPNHAHFPSAQLIAGDEFYSVTRYQILF